MSNVLAMDPTVELMWSPKCDSDLPETERLQLKYRCLTAREEATINDKIIKSTSKGKTSKYSYSVSSADLDRCEKTIKGWVGFTYPSNHPKAGIEIPFNLDNIGMIPSDVRSEFVDFLTKRDKASDDDEKDEEDLGEAKAE